MVALDVKRGPFISSSIFYENKIKCTKVGSCIEMIYAKEFEHMARVLLGDEIYNSVATKTSISVCKATNFMINGERLQFAIR